MNRLLLASIISGIASVAAAQDTELEQTCLVTFYGIPLVEGPCKMTNPTEKLVQLWGEVPENGVSYQVIADDVTGTATFIGAGTFILAAGTYDSKATSGDATFNWPNGYAFNAVTAIK